MKKAAYSRSLAILILALCFVLSACSSGGTYSPSAPDSSSSAVGFVSSADFDIVREDESICDAEGNIGINWYFDKLVINSSCKGADAINADMESKVSEFFSDEHRAQMEEYFNSVYLAMGYDGLVNGESAEVTCNDYGIISVKYTTDWYMGGVANRDYYGVTYDLNSGRELQLSDLLEGDESALLPQIREIFWNALVEHYTYDGLSDNARAALDGKALEDFDFFVAGSGEIYLISHVYEYSYGGAGSYAFGSGLFISELS